MVRKFSKHTPEQIVRKLDKARELRESGSTTAQILTELRISEATLNRWQATCGSITKSEAKELQRLREENTRLKRLLGQAELEKAAWKELSYDSRYRRGYRGFCAV
ncbi:transposase [Alloscardovia sp. HMSC034E08]|uniref:transposase n=1 Tax=Alloscardovia sp. HMSC034E08 TaxID=1739413 RepID=UPI0009FBBFE5